MTDWLAKIGIDESKLGFERIEILPSIMISKAIIYLAETISKSISDAATKISGRLS